MNLPPRRNHIFDRLAMAVPIRRLEDSEKMQEATCYLIDIDLS